MSAITHGMNPEEVEQLGHTLQQKAEELQSIMGRLNGLVNSTTWVGPDAAEFKGPWWDGHRAQLQKISQDLRGFGQSALNNASEQRSVSGR